MTLPLFGIEESRRLRDEAIDTVERSRAEWLARFTHCVTSVAVCLRTFTTDDVMRNYPDLEECPEKRVLGAVMRSLRKDGAIGPTGRYVSSARTVSHARPKREWKVKP